MRVLQSLKRNVAGVQNLAVASQDGFLIAHTFHVYDDAAKLAATSAQFLSWSAKLSAKIKETAQQEIIIKNEDYILYIFDLDAGILAASLRAGADLSRFQEYAKEAVATLKDMLREMLYESEFTYLMGLVKTGK